VAKDEERRIDYSKVFCIVVIHLHKVGRHYYAGCVGVLIAHRCGFSSP
jgi:hypothetical protein